MDTSNNFFKSGVDTIINNPTYFIFSSVIELIILALILYKWNPLDVSTNYPQVSALLMIIIAFIQLSMYFFTKSKNAMENSGTKINVKPIDVLIKIIISIITVFITIALSYIILNYGVTAILFIVHSIVYIAIGIVTIALLYLLFKPLFNTIKNSTSQQKSTFLKLIGQLVLYLPCALIDIIDWAKEEYRMTTKPVWILLGIEALLISLNFLFPKFISWLSNKQGKKLLTDPVYLDSEHIIGNYDTLYGSDNSRDYTYSLSGWFWINPQPPNTGKAYTKFTNILEFGGKPAITYNTLENCLRVTCRTNPKEIVTIYETHDVKYQAWNNIVINYDAGTMDVFINGELVASKPDIAPYLTYENIIVGSIKGIQGGIANVMYHDSILQSNYIKYLYQSLKDLPIPII